MSAITVPPPPVAPTPEVAPRRPSGPSPLAKVAVAILLVLAASACAHRTVTPTSYGGTNSAIEKNFLSGCSGEKDGKTIDVAGKTDTGAVSSDKVCGCEWTAIKKDIPFDDFKKYTTQLTDHPGPLPSALQKIVDTCNGT